MNKHIEKIVRTKTNMKKLHAKDEFVKEKDTVELPEEIDPFMIQSFKDVWRMAEVINQIIKWGHSIEECLENKIE